MFSHHVLTAGPCDIAFTSLFELFVVIKKENYYFTPV